MVANEKANVQVTVNNEEAKSQLKELQTELARIKQLRKEAFEKGDTAAFSMYDKEFQKVGRSAEKMKSEVDRVEVSMKNLNGLSLSDLGKELGQAQKVLNKMKQTDPGFDAQKLKVQQLRGAYTDLKTEMGNTGGFMGKLTGIFGGIPGPAGAAVNGLMGLGKAMWALVANPLGAMIAGLVGSVVLLYKAFKSTDDGATKLEGIFKGLGNIVDVLMDRTASFLSLLGSIATLDLKGIKENGAAAFGGLAKQIAQTAAAGVDYASTLDDIEDREVAASGRMTKLRVEIENLKNATKDKTLSDKERMNAAQSAMDKEIQLNQLETKFLNEKNKAEANNLATKIQSSKLTIEQKQSQLDTWLMVDDLQLNSMLENDKAFSVFYNKNSAEFQELQKQKAAELMKEAELATGTRRLQSELSGFKKELQLEELQASEAEKKKAIEAIEAGFEKENLSLKQQYAGKEELDKEFKARSLANELAYMNMKLALTTDNKEQLILKQQIRDKENEYNLAIEAAVIPLMKKKEAATNLNTTTLETNKLTEINTKKTNEATDAVEKLAKKQQAAANVITGASSIIAEGLYDMASGTEGAMKKMGKALLKYAIELLKKQALVAVASSTVQSLAQADSVTTFGATGLIRAAILSGLIEVAAAGLNGLVDSLEVGGYTHQASSDSTPVGVVHANEWVASAPLLRNPATRSHIDYLENVQRGLTPRFNTSAISGAVHGFQSGGFASSAVNTTSQQPVTIIQQTDPALLAAIQRMNDSADHLASKPLALAINTREIFKSEEGYQSAIKSSEY